MSRACAPSAERTPISRVRCATLNDRTPKSPTPAISSANVANHVSTIAYSRGFARLVITRSSIVITESSAIAGACSWTRLRNVATCLVGSSAVRTTRMGSKVRMLAGAICLNDAKISGCSGASMLSWRMSSTTPTTSHSARSSGKRSAPARGPRCGMRTPSGRSPRYCRAKVRLTTIAGGVEVVSASVSARPETRRRRIAGK